MVLVVVVFVVTKAVDTVVAFIARFYLVAIQNVVKNISLTVVSFAKQLLTQDVLYQVNSAFVLKIPMFVILLTMLVFFSSSKSELWKS